MQNLLNNFPNEQSQRNIEDSFDSKLFAPISNLENIICNNQFKLQENERDELSERNNKENFQEKLSTQFPKDNCQLKINPNQVNCCEKEGREKKFSNQIRKIIEKRNYKANLKKEKIDEFEHNEILNNSLLKYNFTFSGIRGIVMRRDQRNVADFDILEENSSDEYFNENATIRKIKVNKSIKNII